MTAEIPSMPVTETFRHRLRLQYYPEKIHDWFDKLMRNSGISDIFAMNTSEPRHYCLPCKTLELKCNDLPRESPKPSCEFWEQKMKRIEGQAGKAGQDFPCRCIGADC